MTRIILRRDDGKEQDLGSIDNALVRMLSDYGTASLGGLLMTGAVTEADVQKMNSQNNEHIAKIGLSCAVSDRMAPTFVVAMMLINCSAALDALILTEGSMGAAAGNA